MQIRVPAAQIEVLAEADVVVCGGGCAGVTAAVAAARHGASVVLLERWPTVGGMATNALVNGWHRSDREKMVIYGLVEESAQRAEKESWIVRDGHYPHAHETHWFDPEGMRIVWQRLLDEAKVRLFCYTAAGDPIMEDGRIRAVCANCGTAASFPSSMKAMPITISVSPTTARSGTCCPWPAIRWTRKNSPA